MNRFLITFLTLVFYLTNSMEMYAAQRTWNGSLSTSWTTAGNWTPSGAPGTTDTATIVSATNNPVLAANTSINRLTMSSGNINLGGYSLTVNQRIACNGGSITNGKFIVRGTVASFAGTTFGCKVEAIVAQLKLDGGVYSDSCYFEQTGGSTGNGQGGNVFNGPVTIRNSGTSTLQTAIAAVDTFNFPLSIFNSSNLSSAIVFSNGNNTVFNGNISISNSGSGQIAFGSAAGSSTSTLASGKTIAATAGAFKRGGLVLNRFTQIGSTAQTITLDSVAFINIANSQINGALTISSPAIILKANTFNGNVEITKTGLTTNNSDGGNTFNGNLIINNTASNGSAIRMATSTGDTYNGNLTLNSNNAFIQMAYADTSILKGNCSINHVKATFNSGAGTLQVSGTSSQSFSGSATYAFGKLIIYKTSNGITFSQPATIDTTLRFLKGFIFTDSVNSITLRASASVFGASDSGYVDGYVKKIGNSSFTFPVGDSGIYVPIEITAPSVNTDAFLATFIAEGQTAGNSKDYTIKFIDNCNYWKLYRTTGSSAVNVKLSWQAIGCPILDSASILVANWNGSTWKNLGRTSFTGSRNNGTITNSSAVNSFNQFTLGYTACQLNAYIVGSGDSLKAKCLNGTPSYTYLWSTGATTSYILGSQAGTTYTVTITDASGCSDNSSISRIFQKVTSGPVVNEANNSYYASWGDYDNDNDLDLFHSVFFAAPNNTLGHNFLFQNTCNGNFSQVQTIPGDLVSDALTGTYSKWIDYDNDGDEDLYVGPGILYENLADGSFVKGINQITTLPTYSSPIRDAGFADYDNDGLLDVYFGHTKIYKNNGSKDFTETSVSAFSGVASSNRCDAVAWADYDNDGYLDVLVTNSNAGVNNYLYHNNGNGTFTSNTSCSQLIEASQNSYGCAWGDIDNDNDLDLWLNNNATGDRLFVNNGSGSFALSSQSLSTGGSPKQAGAAWADFDNDGDLDLFVPSFNKNYLFYNNGSGIFTKDSIEIVSSDVTVESYAGSFSDYDNDGDLDLFVPTAYNSNPNDLFYTNTINPETNAGYNYVKFSCIGIASNKDAIGARVRIYANVNGVSKWQMREINGNSTRSGESGGISSSVVHFGLGNASVIDSVEIFWPVTNETQIFTGVSVNEYYKVIEDSDTLTIVTPCVSDLPLSNPKIITGIIYSDIDSDCTYDSTDFPIANAFVKASPGNYYTLTNDSGYYFIKVPEGEYTVDANFLESRWSLASCATDSAFEINTVGFDTIANINFPQVVSRMPCSQLYTASITPHQIDTTGCGSAQLVRGPCPGYRMKYCFNINSSNNNFPSPANTQIVMPLPPGYVFLSVSSVSAPCTVNIGTSDITVTITNPIPINGSFDICMIFEIDLSASVSDILINYINSGGHPNLVTNGQFSGCTSAANCNFTTGYSNTSCDSVYPGIYCFAPDASQIHWSWSGQAISNPTMVCFDGISTTNAWCQRIDVDNSTEYFFEFFALEVDPFQISPAEIEFTIDNVTVMSQGPLPNAGWNLYQFTWCSTNQDSIDCCIRTVNPDSSGNDFCLDDIVIRDYDSGMSAYLFESEDCSCDPNYLKVYPSGCGNEGVVAKNRKLDYTVNFHNTGTGNAHNIYITANIDQNLDLTTFKMLSSSHLITGISIDPNNKLTISLSNIELEPDSVGLISYSISPKVGLSDGAKITCQAGIYFDNNEVVITNLVKNTLYNAPLPDATFDYSTSCTNPNLAYDFEYTGGTSNISSYSWTFQDGNPSTSSLENPADIEFSSIGSKIVTLTVTRDGCSAIYADTIHVQSYLNYTKDSVYVCHSGNTLLIDLDSLHSHNNHGDCIGYCVDYGRKAYQEKLNDIEAKVVPNPSNGKFEVTIENIVDSEENFEIQIFNSVGNQIFMPFHLAEISKNRILYTFDGNVPPGVYFVRIKGKSFNKSLKLLRL